MIVEIAVAIEIIAVMIAEMIAIDAIALETVKPVCCLDQDPLKDGIPAQKSRSTT